MKKIFTHSAMKIYSFASAMLVCALMTAQVTFTNQGAQLQTISGFSSADCAVDVNGDGLDDVVRWGANTI